MNRPHELKSPRDFRRRSYEPEIMDAGIGSFSLYDESLKQIEAVNGATFGYRPVLRWLGERFETKRSCSVLDIGFGRGDLLRRIWRVAQRRHADVRLAGVDVAQWSVSVARAATPHEMNIDYHLGNVFGSGETADFITCSHMAHHMNDREIVALVKWMEAHARRGWFICDLQRHFLSYLLARLVLFFAPVNAMVRNDGAQSVARAFTRGEWQKILADAGVTAEIRWHFPFRFGISRVKQA